MWIEREWIGRPPSTSGARIHLARLAGYRGLNATLRIAVVPKHTRNTRPWTMRNGIQRSEFIVECDNITWGDVGRIRLDLWHARECGGGNYVAGRCCDRYP